jgi:hypothetical protein
MDSNVRYKKLTTGFTSELRQLAHRMLADPDRLPGRKELKAEIAALIPDDHQDLSAARAAVEKRLVELAGKAQDRSARFELRGLADEWALAVGGEMERRDCLVSAADEEPVDISGALDAVAKHEDPTGVREDVWQATATTEERVARIERERRAGQS